MAKIYDLPDGFTEPQLNFSNIKGYKAEVEKLFTDLKAWCLERMAKAGVTQEGVGEIIDFPVADGKAMYMVAAMKPLQLIHLTVWDRRGFQYATKLTAKDVKEKIR
jgi:hypothetical protein